MSKIVNPNFVVPNQGRVNALKAALPGFLAAKSADAELDFEAIRAGLGPADLTDGEIAQAAQDAGLKVVS